MAPHVRLFSQLMFPNIPDQSTVVFCIALPAMKSARFGHRRSFVFCFFAFNSVHVPFPLRNITGNLFAAGQMCFFLLELSGAVSTLALWTLSFVLR